MTSYRDLVIEAIRTAHGPVTVEQIIQRVSESRPILATNPKNTVRSALSYNPLVATVARGRYVYVPRVVTGASFRIPIENVDPKQSKLIVGAEVAECVKAARSEPAYSERMIRVTSDNVPPVDVKATFVGDQLGGAGLLDLPNALRDWIERQRQAGADALVLRCLDGETGQFTLEALDQATVDRAALAARNEQVLALARQIGSKERLVVREFARLLVVRGAYHGEPQPDPLPYILYELDGRFVVDISTIKFRPELTPALRRVLADRLRFLQESSILSIEDLRARMIEEEDEAIASDEVAEEDLALAQAPPRPRGPATCRYRLKVTLEWMPSVWRIIDVLDNQTLADLHEAIQDAFHWDRDHLYAFFLSGKAWDSVTEVGMPPTFFGGGDSGPPYSDEVTFDDLELKPGQRFLYLFDFGDKLRHDVEVLEELPGPAKGTHPRIVERHGKAPPQYPRWDG